MTKEELREHCEKQVKMCEEWAKGNDREPSGKIYEEHKLILDLINELQDKSYELWKESYEEEHRRNIRLEEKIKALEQQPSEDCVSRMEVLRIVSNFWLNKDIDNKVFSRITDCFNAMPYVLPKLPTSDDCVSRQAVLDKAWDVPYEEKYVQVVDVGDILELPPVTPTFPKGVTNGDILKIVFPNIEWEEIHDLKGDKNIGCTNKFWNAPYKE